MKMQQYYDCLLSNVLLTFIVFVIILRGEMRKRSNNSQGSDRSQEGNPPKREKKFITFNYGNNLECFITPASQKMMSVPPLFLKNNLKKISQPKTQRPSFQEKSKSPFSHLKVPRTNRGKFTSNTSQTFTNKILLLQYEGEEEPQHEQLRAQTEYRESPKSEDEDQEVSAVVKSCMRVITQETEHTSNPISARFTPHSNSTPNHSSVNVHELVKVEHIQHQGEIENREQMRQMEQQMAQIELQHQQYNQEMEYAQHMSQSYSQEMSQHYAQHQMQQHYHNQMMSMMQMVPNDYYYYMNRPASVRNRRAISTEESRAYVIDLNKVQSDGRTTIMVRNIPNKYTQGMLLELFEKNHKKKFDFFYLPIDYNNNCNVGYAFLNFIHSKFIIDFHRQFHGRKWNRFNSVKVCQIWYARIQGTAQLQHHFQHSNVLQQKDKRFRPLIGFKSLADIQELVKKQKDEHASGEDSEES